MIWLTWKGLSLLGLQSHCENAGFQPFGKKPLNLAVAALWGTSITKVPFNQMVMLTGGWPDWRWLYIWNGPTNLDIRLPVAAVEKKKPFFLKCKTKTCMNHVSPPAVLWCLMAFAVMRIKLVILKQPEPLSKVIVFCASCHYMSNMTF